MKELFLKQMIQTEPENPETPETPEGGDGTEGGTEVDPETPEGGDGIEGDTEVDPEVNPDENEDETTEIAPTADLAIDEGQTVAVMVGDEVNAGDKGIVNLADFHYLTQITKLIGFAHCFGTAVNVSQSLGNKRLTCFFHRSLCKLQRFLACHL